MEGGEDGPAVADGDEGARIRLGDVAEDPGAAEGEEAGTAAMRPGGRESMSATIFSFPAMCRISEVNSAT